VNALVLAMFGTLALAYQRRAKQAPIEKSRALGEGIERVTLVGNGEWALVGHSESFFELVGAPAIVRSAGFEVRTESEEIVSIPPGTRLTITAMTHARRVPLEPALDEDGVLRERFMFELPVGESLFIPKALSFHSDKPYRYNQRLVFAGSALALANEAELVRSRARRATYLFWGLLASGVTAAVVGSTVIAMVIALAAGAVLVSRYG
jgi:hypothetical protein